MDCAKIKSITNQTVGNGAQAGLLMVTEEFTGTKVRASAATSAIIVDEPDKYLVVYEFYCIATVGGLVTCELMINDVASSLPVGLLQYHTQANPASLGMQVIVTLGAGDTVKLRVTNTSGASVDIVPSLTVIRLAA